MTFKFPVLLMLAFVLSGCGQSGPLYVPGDPSSIKAPEEAPDGEEENDEDNDS